MASTSESKLVEGEPYLIRNVPLQPAMPPHLIGDQLGQRSSYIDSRGTLLQSQRKPLVVSNGQDREIVQKRGLTPEPYNRKVNAIYDLALGSPGGSHRIYFKFEA